MAICFCSCNNHSNNDSFISNIADEDEIDSLPTTAISVKSCNFFICTNDKYPIILLPIKNNDSIMGYFFVDNFKDSIKITPLLPIYKKDFYGKNHSKYIISSYDTVSEDTLAVHFYKRFLFIKCTRTHVEIFVRNASSSRQMVKRRYLQEVFENYGIKSDIEYGRAKGHWTSNVVHSNDAGTIITKSITKLINIQTDQSLKFDYYYPENDYLERRPLIVFVHGGAFFIGDKKDVFLDTICPYFAKCGYSVASINYRMGFGPSYSNYNKEEYKATQDLNAAIRYLVHNATEYAIDTSNIFLFGSSAGAITCLNSAFLDKNEIEKYYHIKSIQKALGGIDESGNDYKDIFIIKGVINLWGAVNDSNIISRHNNIAVLSIHGDHDSIVPINCDYPLKSIPKLSKMFLDKICGSEIIDRRLKYYGIKSKFIKIKGASHALIYDKDDNLNKYFSMVKKESTRFLYSITQPHLQKFLLKDILYKKQELTKLNSSKILHYRWDAIGGCIIQKNGRTDIIWFSNISEHSLELIATNTIHSTNYIKEKINIYE